MLKDYQPLAPPYPRVFAMMLPRGTLLIQKRYTRLPPRRARAAHVA
jgi:hypothetical protein